MTTPTEKNHNKHLDLLHDYKIYLIKQVQELENETSNELKQQYLIAKLKIEALESTHYEKI